MLNVAVAGRMSETAVRRIAVVVTWDEILLGVLSVLV
jgi:hypothetical protein